METIIDIRQAFNECGINPEKSQSLSDIEQLLKAAILDPDEKTRARLAKTLNKHLDNRLEGGFAADNQLFIKLRIPLKDKQYTIVSCYLCDMPKEYIGSPSKPHRFYRK